MIPSALFLWKENTRSWKRLCCSSIECRQITMHLSERESTRKLERDWAREWRSENWASKRMRDREKVSERGRHTHTYMYIHILICFLYNTHTHTHTHAHTHTHTHSLTHPYIHEHRCCKLGRGKQHWRLKGRFKESWFIHMWYFICSVGIWRVNSKRHIFDADMSYVLGSIPIDIRVWRWNDSSICEHFSCTCMTWCIHTRAPWLTRRACMWHHSFIHTNTIDIWRIESTKSTSIAIQSCESCRLWVICSARIRVIYSAGGVLMSYVRTCCFSLNKGWITCIARLCLCTCACAFKRNRTEYVRVNGFKLGRWQGSYWVRYRKEWYLFKRPDLWLQGRLGSKRWILPCNRLL